MTQVNHMKRLGAALLGAAVLTGTAHAAGTDAGTTVSNTFTLNYDVGGTPQPPIDNTGSPTQFTVDRLVDLTITTLDPTLSVAPGSSAGDNIVRYALVNLGNDNQGYDLSVVNSGAYTPGTVTIRYFLDDNANGILDGAETLVTYSGATEPDDIAPDQQVVVLVESDVPPTAVDGDAVNLVLTADTLHATNPIATCGTCTPGAVVTGDSDGNSLTGEAETFLADGAGQTDGSNAGDYSSQAVLTVLAPTLTAVKTVAVFATAPATEAACTALTSAIDANQYSVPGACVRYEINVSNTGAGSATNLLIVDELPAEVRFLDASITGNFADDTSIAGAGPTLAEPAVAVDCNGSNCEIELSDAILAGGDSGTILIWALVQ